MHTQIDTPYLKMLVVDDEPLMRQGFSMFFDWEKYLINDVIEAENGSEAIRISRKEKPDIVISDIRMSEIDGLKMIEALKEIIPDAVFIIISGYDNFDYAKQAISLGVLHYLVKPIHSIELHEVMLKCIKKIEEQNRRKKAEKELYDKLRESMPVLRNNFGLGKPRKIIEEITAYVKENINTEISLNKIAEKFYYNPNYLSRLFKEETNTNFLEYVNEIRMQMAMELFDTTDMAAYSICEKVGYRDYKYFTTIFKRIAKMTPHEYRNRRTACL